MNRSAFRSRRAALVLGAATLVIGPAGFALASGLASSPAIAAGATPVITTIAGGGTPSVSGPATNGPLSSPTGLATAGSTLYVTGGGPCVVRAVSASGIQSVVAGNGTCGYTGDGGAATSAQIAPGAIAADKAGDLLMVASYRVVRFVPASSGTYFGTAMSAGDIYTVAGNDLFGFAGDGGPAVNAELSYPGGVSFDSFGNIVVVDTSNGRVRVVAAQSGTFYGIAMTVGDIYTVAGGGTAQIGDGGPATSATFNHAEGVAIDASGNILIADSWNARIRVVPARSGTFYGIAMSVGDIYSLSANPGPGTTTGLVYPEGVTTDSSGNVIITGGNDQVNVVAESNGTFYGIPMTAGYMYTVAGTVPAGTEIFWSPPPSPAHCCSGGDGGPAIAAGLWFPDQTTVDTWGNIVIADTGNSRVRVVAATSGTFYGIAMTAGDIYTVAGNGTNDSSGDGGAATSATMGWTQGVAVAGSGNIAIALRGDELIRMVAGTSGTFYGIAMTAGDVYTVAGDGNLGNTPNTPTADHADGGGVLATSIALEDPEGVAADRSGNLIVYGQYDTGIQVVAATNGTFYGIAMTAGHIYTVAGNGTYGYAGDGGPATAAELNGAQGATVDSSGNIVLADTSNGRVRVVAAASGNFYGVAMTAGDIYTIAGGGSASGNGPGTLALLASPQALAVDGFGNVVVVTGGTQIRVLAESTGTFYGVAMTAGDIYTVAGTTYGYSGDGGPGLSAQLALPGGVALDSGGNIVIADTSNNRVRLLAANSGTYDGIAMTAGDIYTVAGNGTIGFSGDGGSPTSAELNQPSGVAADGSSLLIADTGNGRIREIASGGSGSQTAQAISLTTPTTASVGGSSLLSATGGASGNPVTFSVDESSAAGSCSLSGQSGSTDATGNGTGSATINFSGPGSCVIDANQAGSASYAAATTVRQTIAVTPPAGSPVTVTVTVSGTQVYGSSSATWTQTNNAPAGITLPGNLSCSTVNGGTAVGPSLTVAGYTVDGGSCSGLSPSDPVNYNLVYVGLSNGFMVSRATQSISFGTANPSPAAVGTTYTPAATATSGLAVSFAIDASSSKGACSLSKGTVSFNGSGTCLVDANQAGSTNFFAAGQVQQSIAVKAVANQAPTITSAATSTGTVGSPFSFTVTATGSPTPTLAVSKSSLPSGLTFTSNSNGTATVTGTPTKGGSTSVTITASNGVTPKATQTLVITIAQPVAITSAASTTATVGSSFSFTVKTSGYPAPSITDGGASLASGLSFVDKENGMATISGIPGAGSAGVYSFTISASNGLGQPSTQVFVLQVDQAPAITSASSVSGAVGSSFSFTVTTTGYPLAAVSLKSGSLSGGLSFTTNANGTATISGVVTKARTYALSLTASNGVSPKATQSLVITFR